MDKAIAIRLLGGNATEAGRAIGIRSQAIVQWPQELPPRIADRVIAALARKVLGERVLLELAEKRIEHEAAQ